MAVAVAFTSFQYDVPNETVTHYDIHAIAEEIVPSDIPIKSLISTFACKAENASRVKSSLDFFSPNIQ